MRRSSLRFITPNERRCILIHPPQSPTDVQLRSMDSATLRTIHQWPLFAFLRSKHNMYKKSFATCSWYKPFQLSFVPRHLGILHDKAPSRHHDERGFSAYRSLNVFVKPNDQRQTCLYLGMARKRRRCQQKLLCFARLCRLDQPRTNLLYSLGFAAWIVQELYCFLPFFLSHIWGDYPCG